MAKHVAARELVKMFSGRGDFSALRQKKNYEKQALPTVLGGRTGGRTSGRVLDQTSFRERIVVLAQLALAEIQKTQKT